MAHTTSDCRPMSPAAKTPLRSHVIRIRLDVSRRETHPNASTIPWRTGPVKAIGARQSAASSNSEPATGSKFGGAPRVPRGACDVAALVAREPVVRECSIRVFRPLRASFPRAICRGQSATAFGSTGPAEAWKNLELVYGGRLLPVRCSKQSAPVSPPPMMMTWFSRRPQFGLGTSSPAQRGSVAARSPGV